MTRPHSAEEYQDTAMFSSVDAAPYILEVVVKLTAQYRSEVYCVLATKGLALMLRACVPVCGDSFMVVLDRVHGEMAWHAASQAKLLPYDIYKSIQDTVALFHPNNLVFGDLCTLNIIVTPGGSSSDARCRGTDRCKGRVCAFLSPVSPRKSRLTSTAPPPLAPDSKIADAARPLSPPALNNHLGTVDRPRQVV